MTDPIAFLDLPKQQARLKDAIDRRVKTVFEHCRFVMGPEVEELEQRLAAFGGAKYAVGVSSGTDALLMVLMGEEIGPGTRSSFLPLPTRRPRRSCFSLEQRPFLWMSSQIHSRSA